MTRRTVSVTVNTPYSEHQYEVPQMHAVIQQEISDNITAAMKLHPDWTSMVITFSNPKLQQEPTL